MKWISKEQVLSLHSELVSDFGGSDGIQDEAMLDSALSTPFQTFGEVDLYPGVVEKAVRIDFGLVKNHPFVDGNKRIGTHMMLVFLKLNNNVEIEYEDDELIAVICLLRQVIWILPPAFRWEEADGKCSCNRNLFDVYGRLSPDLLLLLYTVCDRM